MDVTEISLQRDPKNKENIKVLQKVTVLYMEFYFRVTKNDMETLIIKALSIP